MSKTKKELYTSTFTFEGKRYYVRSAKSQREADRKADQKKRDLEEQRYILSPETTVAKYAEHWYTTFIDPTVSEPVAKGRWARINKYVLPEIGRVRLKDVKKSMLQRILNDTPGMSKNHYTKLRADIQSVFRYALDDQLILRDPSTGLKLPEAEDGTNRSLTREERAAILYAADWHTFGLFVQIMLRCGLRPQEVAVLEPTDIDAINRQIRVTRALKATGAVGKTKSRDGVRIVPIPPELWVRLAPRLKRDGKLVTDYQERPYNRDRIRKGWEHFKWYVDILLGAETDSMGSIITSVIADDLTLYCLRHTYCTDLEAAGVPINVARYLMGHSKIELTARIYTHMAEDTMRNAATLIDLYNQTLHAPSSATAGATEKRLKPSESVTSGTKSSRAKPASNRRKSV